MIATTISTLAITFPAPLKIVVAAAVEAVVAVVLSQIPARGSGAWYSHSTAGRPLGKVSSKNCREIEITTSGT